MVKILLRINTLRSSQDELTMTIGFRTCLLLDSLNLRYRSAGDS